MRRSVKKNDSTDVVLIADLLAAIQKCAIFLLKLPDTLKLVSTARQFTALRSALQEKFTAQYLKDTATPVFNYTPRYKGV